MKKSRKNSYEDAAYVDDTEDEAYSDEEAYILEEFVSRQNRRAHRWLSDEHDYEQQ